MSETCCLWNTAAQAGMWLSVPQPAPRHAATAACSGSALAAQFLVYLRNYHVTRNVITEAASERHACSRVYVASKHVYTHRSSMILVRHAGSMALLGHLVRREQRRVQLRGDGLLVHAGADEHDLLPALRLRSQNCNSCCTSTMAIFL